MSQTLLFGHYCLLHHMARVQQDPEDLIAVEYFSVSLCSVRAQPEKKKTVYLREHWRHELKSCLDSLVEKDCIEYLGEEDQCHIYRLKYDSRRVFQSVAVRLGHFLLTSIAVPIVVSVITTLLTVWISGALSS